MERSYSVAQVNQYIKNMFLQDFVLKDICIKAEVSNCKYHTSGHIYFTLKDGQSMLQAVMFAGNRIRGLKFKLQDGMKILVKGRIEVYERDGKYQLYASQITQEGMGDLYERFLHLKKELEEYGLFAKEYKKAIPSYARNIGIVTASTGAAIRDIFSVSKRRDPYVQLVLYPAIVQGEYAVSSIVKGIQVLDKLGLDIIIIGRGGGSIEDLWAFNEEKVARAIFDADTPIISAVGHETDFTIADFVADLRAATPSVAAELSTMDYMEFMQKLSNSKNTLTFLMQRKLERASQNIKQKVLHLENLSPTIKLRTYQMTLDANVDKLENLMQKKIQQNKHTLSLYIERLRGLSPLEKISKGYAFITKQTGERIQSVKELQMEEILYLYLADGSIKVQVLEVEKNEKLY